MWRIGITGSIATGKSTVLKSFEKAGVPVFSADAAVAALYQGAAVAPLEHLFPGIARNGVVDRQALAARLAEKPEGFKALEAVVHPLVRLEIAAFLAAAQTQGHAVAAVEVPLLYESGYDYGFDLVAVTHVDEAVQRERVMARPGMTVEKRDTLLARQMPQSEKKARGDILFDTALPPEVIDREVGVLVERLRKKAKP